MIFSIKVVLVAIKSWADGANCVLVPCRRSLVGCCGVWDPDMDDGVRKDIGALFPPPHTLPLWSPSQSMPHLVGFDIERACNKVLRWHLEDSGTGLRPRECAAIIHILDSLNLFESLLGKCWKDGKKKRKRKLQQIPPTYMNSRQIYAHWAFSVPPQKKKKSGK